MPQDDPGTAEDLRNEIARLREALEVSLAETARLTAQLDAERASHAAELDRVEDALTRLIQQDHGTTPGSWLRRMIRGARGKGT